MILKANGLTIVIWRHRLAELTIKQNTICLRAVWKRHTLDLNTKIVESKKMGKIVTNEIWGVAILLSHKIDMKKKIVTEEKKKYLIRGKLNQEIITIINIYKLYKETPKAVWRLHIKNSIHIWFIVLKWNQA